MQTHTFQDRISGFSNLYMQVERLSRTLEQSPCSADRESIAFFSGVLRDKTHSGQKCAYFLYRQAAMGLKSIIAASENPELAQAACSTLHSFSLENLDQGCFAASQALGTLPLNLKGPQVPQVSCRMQEWVPWCQVPDSTGMALDQGSWLGRSLVFRDQDSDNLLVLKLARENDRLQDLAKEASWMQYLQENFRDPAVRFDLPQPVPVQGDTIFSLDSGTLPLACPFAPHPQGAALAYQVHSDYFIYPNHPETVQQFSKRELLQILSRNSYLLGRLCSDGILHTAPIPLFHNRVQEYRREDSGAYIWTRAGRLDRWYHSCMYPNLALSGLRDFEHLQSHSGNARDLFQVMGEHFLGLLLLAGSCFRSRQPGKMGLDANHAPIDARDLFDPGLLEQMILEIFNSYYQGFVGSDPGEELSLQNVRRLVERMIQEMGVDRNMAEILRIEDQLSMSEQEFFDFLSSRGVDRVTAQSHPRGVEEVSLNTGPHLGGFNQRFSLPELIDFAAGATSACVLGKFLQWNYFPDEN
ncbi:MAG: SidJ-related pseudokinase [Thermodesulfobacteriota bacterium]